MCNSIQITKKIFSTKAIARLRVEQSKDICSSLNFAVKRSENHKIRF